PSSASDLFPPPPFQRTDPHPTSLDGPLPPPLIPRPHRPMFTAPRPAPPPPHADQIAAPRSSSRAHRYHHSTGSAFGPPPGSAYPLTNPRYRSMLDPSPPGHPQASASPFPVPPRGYRVAPHLPPHPDAGPQPSRPQIAEEDECPVCGNELPPKAPDGSEVERERHVEECIASHFTPAASSRPAEPAPPPDPTLPQNFPSLVSSSAPSHLPPSNPLSRSRAGSSAVAAAAEGMAEPRRRRATGNRMLVYTATEKDCAGDEGSAAECIICFEEFEPGTELGRLECLCKFHRVSLSGRRACS
ncbi:MAG: hypothetical protein INR71_11590, partial [Terriglobus roseus]|nr:hypothetical protein [Terriglobus roseus]